jgi:ferredoxin
MEYEIRRRKMMRAAVKKELCIGCGFCARSCRRVFRMTDDWTAEVYADVTEDTLELAQFAALKCPIKAITLEE